VLRELHISNLAVISDVRIELAAGLNCFTGATGAGKSLVIGAIEVLLGMRSPAEMLRPGADEGRVSGVFEVRNKSLLKEIEHVTDVQVTADGGELLITRRLYASGRSSVSLNGNPITLSMLKAAAEHLVDVHGQHDHQYLLKPSNQLAVIDEYGQLDALRAKYHEAYARVVEAKQRMHELSASKALREQQLELYRFQADEIDTAELDAAEFEELVARSSVLSNLETLKTDAGSAHASLYESDGSAVERLRTIAATLADLAKLDADLSPVATSVKDATIAIEEAARDLSRYLDKLDLDPAELAEVSERLDTVQRVINKYGDARAAGATAIAATLNYREEIGRKIAEMERATDDLSSLQSQITTFLKDVKKLGEELSSKRAGVAKRLGPLVVKALADLGMEKATFTVALSPADGTIPGESLPATPSGFDAIEFIAQTNPGQLAQPLRKIASGGELSRIMLALKGILAGGDRISVLVFDEIDANVGGRLGSIIGNKLRGLAEHHQVLCITHLPQIASYADRHLTVRKEVVGKTTETKVRTMEGPERVQELAEMIGGQRITDTTRAQARELLEAARGEFAQESSASATKARKSLRASQA
jgi:DNA repair protein RecN (Recombination protein N)